MTQQELKQKLLNTSYFEDNEYLDKYCDLIIENLETKKEKYRTQCHHILPKCYFQLIGEEIDNSKENKVNLLYKNHILAHYYLSKCSLNSMKYRLSNAMLRFYSKTFKDDITILGNLNDLQLIYEECIYNTSKLNQELNSIPVQCLETGEVFKSATSADIHFKGYYTSNVSMSARKLEKGLNHRAYGYHWIMLYNKIPLNKDELKERMDNLPSVKKSGTPLGSKRDASTGELLSKKLTGSKRNSIVRQHMVDAWKDPNKHLVQGHRRKIEKSPEEIEEEKIQKEIRKYQNVEKARERNRLGKFHLNHPHKEKTKTIISEKLSIPVQCLETGEVYKNSKEADITFVGRYSTNVGRSCTWFEKGLNKTAYGYHWVRLRNNISPYTAEERQQILKNLPTKVKSTKKVKCIETGEIFNSIKEAQEKYKCNIYIIV